LGKIVLDGLAKVEAASKQRLKPQTWIFPKQQAPRKRTARGLLFGIPDLYFEKICKNLFNFRVPFLSETTLMGVTDYKRTMHAPKIPH